MVQLEKEARLVLNELWAKLSARERFIVFGAIAAIVGWLVGLILGSNTYGSTVLGVNYGVTVNFYTWGTAGIFDHLAFVTALATLVVMYLKVAPNMNITWPMPVVQILLGLTVACVACGLLALLFQFSNGLTGAPALMYVADVLVIGGAGFAAFNGYMEYTASKSAA